MGRNFSGNRGNRYEGGAIPPRKDHSFGRDSRNKALEGWRNRERDALRSLVERGVFVRVDRPFSDADLILEASEALPFSYFADNVAAAKNVRESLGLLDWRTEKAAAMKPDQFLLEMSATKRPAGFAALAQASPEALAKLKISMTNGSIRVLLPGVGTIDADGVFNYAYIDFAHPGDSRSGNDPEAGLILRGVQVLTALRRQPSAVLVVTSRTGQAQ